MRIIDLSMPVVEQHPRWKTTLEVTGDLAKGSLAQSTRISVSCHSYTHVDARRHMFLDGATIEATPLERVVGDCAVIDLSDIQPNEAITPERLTPRAGHLPQNGRVLFKTCWDRHRSPTTTAFWTDAPYLTRESAIWLRDRAVQTVAYDFPQDYPIRLLLKGEERPLPEHVTHDILLRENVTMIEYVCNTAEIREKTVFLCAAPLKIVGSDGAPARVFAIEGR